MLYLRPLLRYYLVVPWNLSQHRPVDDINIGNAVNLSIPCRTVDGEGEPDAALEAGAPRSYESCSGAHEAQHFLFRFL